MVFGAMFYIGCYIFIKVIYIYGDVLKRTAAQKMLVGLFAIIFTGINIGNSTQFMPDIT